MLANSTNGFLGDVDIDADHSLPPKQLKHRSIKNGGAAVSDPGFDHVIGLGFV
jgi:hypothetical protein